MVSAESDVYNTMGVGNGTIPRYKANPVNTHKLAFSSGISFIHTGVWRLKMKTGTNTKFIKSELKKQ